MKKSTIFLSLLSFILLLVIILLGIFLLKSTSDYAKLQESSNIIDDKDGKISDLPLDIDEVDEKPVELKNGDNTVMYSDKSEGLSFEFPISWDLDSDLDLVDDENGTNRVLNFHTLSFTRGSSKLILKYVYVATGTYGQPISESEYEILDLGNILRIKKNGESDWRYATEIECSEMTGFGDYCAVIALSIPGGRMVSATLQSNNEQHIKESDAIVIDASE